MSNRKKDNKILPEVHILGDLNDVKKLDTIIASADIVAADSYAASLFGLQPDEIAYIKAAAAMGLGRSDLSNLRIEEFSVGA